MAHALRPQLTVSFKTSCSGHIQRGRTRAFEWIFHEIDELKSKNYVADGQRCSQPLSLREIFTRPGGRMGGSRLSAQVLGVYCYVMCLGNGGISIAARAIQIYCIYVVTGITRCWLLAHLG